MLPRYSTPSMSKIATGIRSYGSSRCRSARRPRVGLLLSATAVGPVRPTHRGAAVMAFHIVVDAREDHRDERREDELPQLEEQESQASDQAATHVVRRLASCVR